MGSTNVGLHSEFLQVLSPVNLGLPPGGLMGMTVMIVTMTRLVVKLTAITTVTNTNC